MKYHILIVVFIILPYFSFSQIDSLKNNELFASSGCIELPPKYKGGQKAMVRLFADNMKYPTTTERQGIGGKVSILYTVDTFGKTTDIKVLIGVHEDLNQEAIRLIRLLKNWTPGTVNGRKINFYRNQPFIFIPDKQIRGKKNQKHA
jgi:protein TonB